MDEAFIMKGGDELVLEIEALNLFIASREHVLGVCGHTK